MSFIILNNFSAQIEKRYCEYNLVPQTTNF